MNNKILFYLKIIAVILIPSMYTVTYLSSNSDPYGALNNIPVGIVNNDQGYNKDGEAEKVGQDITDNLIASKSFAFEQVDESDFTYDDYFMKITIPKNFSQTIIDFSNNDYNQGKITVEVDESKNYIFASIAKSALIEMQNQVNENIVYEYVNTGLELLDDKSNEVNDYSNSISNYIVDVNKQIDQIQANSNQKYDNFKVEYNNVKDSKNDLVKKFQTDSQQILDDIDNKYEDIKTVIDEKNTKIEDKFAVLDQTIRDNTENESVLQVLDETEKSLNEYKTKYDNKLNKYETAVNEKVDIEQQKIDKLITSDNIEQDIEQEMQTIESIYNDYNQQIDNYQNEVLTSDYLYKQIGLEGNFQKIASFFASPVIFEESRQNEVGTYGEGLAPFFISLSLYVGALILMTVLPVEELKKQIKKANYKKYVLFYSLFSVGQTIALYFLLINVNGITFQYPIYFITYSIFVSLFFISVMTFLTYVLEDIGKFLGFVLLVLQLGGSAGTFPIETAPKFFQIINPFLPMTYTVNQYREILFRPNVNIIPGIIVLILLTIIFFSIGLIVDKYKLIQAKK